MSDYQQWENYPDSPLKTEDYPYQFIQNSGGIIRLFCSAFPIYNVATTKPYFTGAYLRFNYNTVWESQASYSGGLYNNNGTYLESNNPIYTDATLTTVFFAKTTSSAPTNASKLTLTFNKAMADPSGKEAEFSFTINSSAGTINSIALNADTTKLDILCAETILSTDVVSVTYTKGTVVAADATPLESFTADVTNLVV